MKNNELNSESYLLEQELLSNTNTKDCGVIKNRLSELSRDLGNVGRILSDEKIEQELGKFNYNYLKRKYHLSQIKNYIFFFKFNAYCNATDNVILFYYGDNNESREQGYILDKIVSDYDVRVYAVEYNYSKELVFLERYYNITQTPSLIINYRYKLEGLVNYEDIKQYLRIEELKNE